MSGKLVPMDGGASRAAELEPITVGERLRSTMAADYAAPFLTELNRMRALADRALAQREAAERLAASLAARVATEHRRRLDAEAEVEAANVRMERLMRTVAYAPPPPAVGRGARLRRAWRALRTP